MSTGRNHKEFARKVQAELSINYTKALRAVQQSPAPSSAAEREIARDPNSDPVLLHVIASRELSGITDGFNQEDAAANPATPPATLRWLADGPAVADTWVQDRLLKNPSTPVDILRRFMHRDDFARECLAQNPGAGDELILDVVNVEEQNSTAEYWAWKNPGVTDQTREYVMRLRSVDSWKRYCDEETAAKLRTTYNGWLSLQEHRQDPIGDVARDAKDDAGFPAVTRRSQLEEHLYGTAAYKAALDSWDEFRSLDSQ